MGQRNQAKARRRTLVPSSDYGSGLAARFVRLSFGWKIAEYPGYFRLFAGLCNVSPRTVEDWLRRNKPLPKKHRIRLADVCEDRARQYAALAVEMREWEPPKKERKQGVGRVRGG
jgi:hypothetical protein